MEIRPAERLILLMLTEIYDALKIENREVDPAFVRSALFGRHLWAFDWKMHGLFEGEDVPPHVVSDVASILDMHDFLERSYDALNAAEKAEIKDEWTVKFRGFDGNNEPEHMSVAEFLVSDLGRYTNFKGREFNSHSPTVSNSLAMARAFEAIRPTLSHQNGFKLSLAQVKAVLAAGGFD